MKKKSIDVDLMAELIKQFPHYRLSVFNTVMLNRSSAIGRSKEFQSFMTRR